MISQPPILDTALGLARRAGVNRAVVLRLLSTGDLVPDAFVQGLGGANTAPVFLPAKAVDILRLQKISRRYARVPRSRASKILNLCTGPELRSQGTDVVEPCSHGEEHTADGANTNQ